ncbi:MAG: hypothetical protein ACREFO_19315 [Acetobacteraceae bacterium]
MYRVALVLGVALALAGCAVTPMPSTAYLPVGAFGGNSDNDSMAINTAAWAWADPARTHRNLINATRAVMAIEYLGGQLTSDPRWTWMSPRTKLNMLGARTEVREAVGISPNAPSQAVANALLAFSISPTEATAARVMTPPVFVLPPQQVVARLDNLPYIPLAAQATSMASAQQFPGGNNFMFSP